jgi:hypothetical protein
VKLALVAAAAVAALALAAQAPARTDCSAGVRTAKGVTYRTFCGPAKVFMTIHTVDYRFDNGGECSKSGGYFSVNIGTITLPPGKPKYAYFGIAVLGTHAGTFKNQAVTWQLPGGVRGSLINTTVEIAPGMKKGTFTGTVLGKNVVGNGSFTC